MLSELAEGRTVEKGCLPEEHGIARTAARQRNDAADVLSFSALPPTAGASNC